MEFTKEMLQELSDFESCYNPDDEDQLLHELKKEMDPSYAAECERKERKIKENLWKQYLEKKKKVKISIKENWKFQ